MRNKKPPFEITNEIVDSVAQIAELVGHLTVTNQLTSNPTLRRWQLSKIHFPLNK